MLAAVAAIPEQAADYDRYKREQNDASNAAYRAGDYDRCRQIETESLAAARRFGDRKEEALSLYGLGMVATATGQPDLAEKQFRQSIALWRELKDQKGVAQSLRGLGRVLEAKGQLPEATEVQVAGLELLLKFGSPMDQSESYYSLARLFMNLENYPASRHAVDRAIELMGPTPPDFPLGLNLALRSDVLRLQGEADAALAAARDSAAAFERAQSPIGGAIANLALGKSLAATGALDKGLARLRAGEATALEVKEAVLASDLQLAEGSLLVQAGRHQDALVPLQAALKTAEDLSLEQLRRNTQLELEKAYSGLGDTAKALAASKQAFEAQNRLAGLEKIGQMAGRSAESQLAAINSRFLSLDDATRAGAPVLAAAPARAAAAPGTPPRGAWLLAAFAALGLLLAGRQVLRLRAQHRALASANADLQDRSAQLAQQVSLDPLTGVLTRRAFADELAVVLDFSQSTASPLTLALFDLDHFKQINDRHGHLSGDAALRLLVGLVREQLDSDDLFGRFGGDEFLIASRAPAASVAGLAERIRAAVEQRSRAPASDVPPLTISLGLAQADPVRGYDPETLFHRADTALYAAKAAGRNRVVMADDQAPARHDPRSLLQASSEA